MDSVRQNKVGRLLMKELAEILRQMTMELCPGGMITVTQVRMSPDLGLAKVYLSIFGADNKSLVMNEIEAKSGQIRRILGNKIKNQLRKMPDMAWYLDDSIDYASHIDDLLKK